MDEAAIDETIAGVKRARKSPKPYAFYFLAADDSGKPALFVGKKPAETKKTGKDAKKTAEDKKFMFGKVRALPNGTLTFAGIEGSAKPKQVQKAFRLELAKLPHFKKIKPFLMSAIIGDLAEIDALFATPETDPTGGDTAPGTAPTESTGGDTQDLDAAMERAKKAFQAARERLGGDHPEFLALDTLRKKASALAKAGDPDAIDAFEDLADAADAAGADEEEVEVTLDVDVQAELVAWRDAIETVDRGISALQNALKNHEDPDLREIAEFGLNGLTQQHKVPLMAALLDATKARGEQRLEAWATVQAAAEAFLNHLKSERAFEAIDNNPFGVDVNVHATLGPALRRILAT